MRKLTGMEEENAKLKEQINEIKIQVSEREKERGIRKPNRSSDSDKEHQKKKKPI
jgi:hypothetical protein